jgi:DcmR-like sensory protein
MRAHGLVPSAGDLGVHDHACWTYDSEDELVAAMTVYFADGARLGQRLLYIGPERPIPSGVEAGALDAIYGLVDPNALAGAFSARADAAVADGYTGLRVVGDLTPLAADPAGRERLLRWEAVADQLMALRPITGFCCYDRRALEDRALRDLCALHPTVHAPRNTVPFRIYRDGRTLVLEGELDYFGTDRLRRALAAAATHGEVLDLRDLSFVDHHAAWTLLKSGVEPRGTPAVMRRVVELLA